MLPLGLMKGKAVLRSRLVAILISVFYFVLLFISSGTLNSGEIYGV